MPVLRRRLVLAAASAAVAIIAGPASSQTSPLEHTVTIADMSYGQIPSGLKVGDTVVWVNHDTVPHSVTARNHSFDLRISPGRRVSMVLDKAGVFPFFCIYHAAMRGTLNVAAK
jgi:plastocyanin